MEYIFITIVAAILVIASNIDRVVSKLDQITVTFKGGKRRETKEKDEKKQFPK